jgi:hypothetical protein
MMRVLMITSPSASQSGSLASAARRFAGLRNDLILAAMVVAGAGVAQAGPPLD